MPLRCPPTCGLVWRLAIRPRRRFGELAATEVAGTTWLKAGGSLGSRGLTAQLPPPPITICAIIAAGVIMEKQLSDNCRALMQMLSRKLSEKGKKSSRTFAIQGLPILLLRTAKKLLFSSQRSREQDRHLFIGSHPAVPMSCEKNEPPGNPSCCCDSWGCRCCG